MIIKEFSSTVHSDYMLQDTEKYLVIPEFLSVVTSRGLLSSILNDANRSVDAGVQVSSTVSEVNKSVRQTSIVHNPKLLDFTPSTQESILSIAQKYWNISEALSYNHSWQGLIYRCGGEYRYHCDNSTVVDGSWKLMFPKRKFTTLLYLSDWTHVDTDHPDKFTGGELVFTHIVDKNNMRPTIYPKAGMLVVFPSNSNFMHQANKVTSGTRVSLVNWIG